MAEYKISRKVRGKNYTQTTADGKFFVILFENLSKRMTKDK